MHRSWSVVRYPLTKLSCSSPSSERCWKQQIWLLPGEQLNAGVPTREKRSWLHCSSWHSIVLLSQPMSRYQWYVGVVCIEYAVWQVSVYRSWLQTLNYLLQQHFKMASLLLLCQVRIMDSLVIHCSLNEHLLFTQGKPSMQFLHQQTVTYSQVQVDGLFKWKIGIDRSFIVYSLKS